MSTYMWVWVCVCGVVGVGVCEALRKQTPRERNRPSSSSVYRSHDIIHNLGAQYIRSLRGGAILPGVGGGGGLNFNVSVYNAVGIPMV